MKGKQALATLAVGAGVALGSFGIAQAAGGLNTGNPAVAPSGVAVPGTAAGLPPSSQVMYAVIRSDGTLARGFMVTTSVRVAPGAYEVTFRHAINQCAYTATSGLPSNSGAATPGYASVVTANDTPSAVFVTTYDSSGASVDLGFHLLVVC